jgi:hypothetical protein
VPRSVGNALDATLRCVGQPGAPPSLGHAPGALRVYSYPGFVQVVIGPLNDDDGAVAADPSEPPRISSFSMQARWFVRLGCVSRRGPLHQHSFHLGGWTFFCFQHENGKQIFQLHNWTSSLCTGSHLRQNGTNNPLWVLPVCLMSPQAQRVSCES